MIDSGSSVSGGVGVGVGFSFGGGGGSPSVGAMRSICFGVGEEAPVGVDVAAGRAGTGVVCTGVAVGVGRGAGVCVLRGRDS